MVGTSHWMAGDWLAAVPHIMESLQLKQDLNDHWGTALCIDVLAWTGAAAGQYARAATLLGAARGLWRLTGSSPASLRPVGPSHRHCEAETRAALGAKAFTAAFRRGARFDRRQAIAYALREKDPTPGCVIP